MRNAPQKLRELNTWSPVDGVVWVGAAALLESVLHCGVVSSVCSLIKCSCCFLHVFEDVISQ